MVINKHSNIIISCLFIIILVSVFINQNFKIYDIKTDTNENRTMATKPEFDIYRLDYFPEKYDSYYNDHFLFRAQYVSFMTYLSRQVFNKANTKRNIIIGKDNWIFSMKDIPWYVGKEDFSDKQLKKFTTEFSMRQEYFSEQNTKMYILICPSKFSVYTEKLPSILKRKRKTRTDKFIQTIKDNTSISIIDGRESLRKQMQDHTVYLKHDTHWNHLGAYFAFSDLMNAIRIDFPEIPNMNLSDFETDTIKETGGNLKHGLPNHEDIFELDYDIHLKDFDIHRCKKYKHLKTDDFRYSQHEYCKRFCTDEGKDSLKAIVFRDSYANSSFKILPAYFNETLYIWDNWKFMLNPKIIEEEHPDIVIYSIYEGYLDRILIEPYFVESEDVDKEIQ